MGVQKLLLRDGIKLLESSGYTFEGIDSGARVYYHPWNPRQHIFLFPCVLKPDDELPEVIVIKLVEALSRSSSVKH